MTANIVIYEVWSCKNITILRERVNFPTPERMLNSTDFDRNSHSFSSKSRAKIARILPSRPPSRHLHLKGKDIHHFGINSPFRKRAKAT